MTNKDNTPTAVKSGQNITDILSEEVNHLLEELDMAVEIKASTHCYPLRLPFKVAGLPEYLPYGDDNQHSGMHFTKISKHDIGSCDVGTIEGVLIRLQQDLQTTSYWAIYLHELHAPNKKGLTKVFRLESHSVDAKAVHFAGFAYRTKNGISPRIERSDAMKGRMTRSQKLASMTDKQLAVWENNWETSVVKALKEALLPVSLWANGMFVELTYLDSSTGAHIDSDKFCRIDAEQINRKIKMKTAKICTA